MAERNFLAYYDDLGIAREHLKCLWDFSFIESELLENPSMEGPADYSSSNTLSDEGSIVFEGTGAIQITYAGDPDLLHQDVTVEPNTNYYLSMFVYVPTGSMFSGLALTSGNSSYSDATWFPMETFGYDLVTDGEGYVSAGNGDLWGLFQENRYDQWVRLSSILSIGSDTVGTQTFNLGIIGTPVPDNGEIMYADFGTFREIDNKIINIPNETYSGTIFPSSGINLLGTGVPESYFHSLNNSDLNIESGCFANSYAEIDNFSGISSKDFTVFFNYEKEELTQPEIIFSTLNTGHSIPYGFTLGINETNKLFLQVPFYTGVNIQPVQNGVAGPDGVGGGQGYIMYSRDNVYDRLGLVSNLPNLALHNIMVRNISGWEYFDNTNWISFTPHEADLLIASVDMGAHTVSSLQGENFEFSGIDAGFSGGNLSFYADRFGSPTNVNTGEYFISGSHFFYNDVPTRVTEVYTFKDVALGKKNALCFTKADNTFTLYYLDLKGRAINDFQSFTTKNFNYNSNYFSLGGNLRHEQEIGDNRFVGCFDNFAYIDLALEPRAITSLISGLLPSATGFIGNIIQEHETFCYVDLGGTLDASNMSPLTESITALRPIVSGLFGIYSGVITGNVSSGNVLGATGQYWAFDNFEINEPPTLVSFITGTSITGMFPSTVSFIYEFVYSHHLQSGGLFNSQNSTWSNKFTYTNTAIQTGEFLAYKNIYQLWSNPGILDDSLDNLTSGTGQLSQDESGNVITVFIPTGASYLEPFKFDGISFIDTGAFDITDSYNLHLLTFAYPVNFTDFNQEAIFNAPRRRHKTQQDESQIRAFLNREYINTTVSNRIIQLNTNFGDILFYDDSGAYFGSTIMSTTNTNKQFATGKFHKGTSRLEGTLLSGGTGRAFIDIDYLENSILDSTFAREANLDEQDIIYRQFENRGEEPPNWF